MAARVTMLIDGDAVKLADLTDNVRFRVYLTVERLKVPLLLSLFCRDRAS